jgi:uncharacterized protein involved in exopolysaccharide biosynthesis
VSNPESGKPAVSQIGAEIDLMKVARLVWKRKLLVMSVTAVCLAAAIAYALLATPIYRADVVVTDARNGSMGAAASLASQFGGLASLAGIDLAGDESLRENRAVLKSRKLAEIFIVQNRLVDVVLQPGAKKHTTWRAVDYFRKNILTIREDARTFTVTVSIDWKDPKVAAAWANGFVGLANEIVRTRALNEANRNIAYLNEQLKSTSSIEVQKVMFRLIESETKNSMLASGRPEFAFTVVDSAAVPEIRLSPKRTLIAIGGLLLGFVLGTLFVVVRELTRPAG